MSKRFKVVLYTFGNRDNRREDDNGKLPLKAGTRVLTNVIDIRYLVQKDPKKIFPDKSGLFEEVQNWVMENGGLEAQGKIVSDIINILTRIGVYGDQQDKPIEFDRLQYLSKEELEEVQNQKKK